MAGHSKWANIKFRKSGQDARRGKQFTKFIREITVAARNFGADVSANPRLRTAIDKALSGNMSRDAIDRAIKRAVGGEELEQLEDIRYEGYGVNGVAVMVDCLTNNRNRTAGEVRHAFTKCAGNLGTSGSVSYLFTERGQIILDKSDHNDTVIDVAIEAGAEDIELQEDGTVEILVTADQFAPLKEKLLAVNAKIVHAEVTMVPASHVELNSEDSKQVSKLIDMLEDLDDVQNVYTNADFS